MGWIDYTASGTGEARLAAFEAAYPEAVVLISDNSPSRQAVHFDDGTARVTVSVVEHVVVKEYRALTEATALSLKDGASGISRANFKLTYADSSFGLHVVNCPALVGTDIQCAVARANEAGGYTLTVTKTTTDCSLPAVSGVISYDVTGAGSATLGDVSVSWGHTT